MADIKIQVVSFKVDDWIYQNDDLKISGLYQFGGVPVYYLAISEHNPLEPTKYDATISVEILRTLSNGIITFKYRTTTVLKFPVDTDKSPTSDLIFALVQKAGYDFFLEFERRKVNTRLQFEKIPVPQLDEQQPLIDKYLEHWERNVRYTKLQ